MLLEHLCQWVEFAMRPLPVKKFIKILLGNGFVLSRQNGSHHIFVNADKGITLAVPVHAGNKPLSIGTFMKLMHQSTVPREFFE